MANIMKQRKFRAWHKIRGFFGDIGNIDFIHGTATMNDFTFYEKDRQYFKVELKDIELLQYTGLLDKNGVEIFEGDVVREWYIPCFSNTQKEIFRDVAIEYSSDFSSGEFDTFKQGFCGLKIDFDSQSKCEIIGTVHEYRKVLKRLKIKI